MFTSNDFEVELRRSTQKKQRKLLSLVQVLVKLLDAFHVALDALDDEPLLSAFVLLALQTW
jgi:hypothetical protein